MPHDAGSHLSGNKHTTVLCWQYDKNNGVSVSCALCRDKPNLSGYLEDSYAATCISARMYHFCCTKTRPGVSYFRLVWLHPLKVLGVKGHMHINKLQQKHS